MEIIGYLLPIASFLSGAFCNGFRLPDSGLFGVTIFVGFDPLTGYERGAVYL